MRLTHLWNATRPRHGAATRRVGRRSPRCAPTGAVGRVRLGRSPPEWVLGYARAGSGAEPFALSALPRAASSSSKVPLRKGPGTPKGLRPVRGHTPIVIVQDLPRTAPTAPARTPAFLLRSRPITSEGRYRGPSYPRVSLGLAGKINRRSYPPGPPSCHWTSRRRRRTRSSSGPDSGATISAGRALTGDCVPGCSV